MLQSYRLTDMAKRKQSSRESRIKINFIIRGKKTQKRRRTAYNEAISRAILAVSGG